MPEEVFGKLLLQPLHAFLESLLPLDTCFLLWWRTIPLLDRWLSSPDDEKEAGDESPKGLFLERMC
jgi:hypothetical protein